MKLCACFLTAIVPFVGVGATFVTDKPAGKASLDRRLFFDPILLRNRTISCATCNREEFAFANTLATNLGLFGRKGTRSTPSAMRVMLQLNFFWDGRAKTLEEQVLIPVTNPNKMDLSIEVAVNRDPLLAKPLGLTKQGKPDLESFLRSLTNKRFLA